MQRSLGGSAAARPRPLEQRCCCCCYYYCRLVTTIKPFVVLRAAATTTRGNAFSRRWSTAASLPGARQAALTARCRAASHQQFD